jgi:hypothetical protein
VAASGTTCIEIGPEFTARMAISGTTCIEIGPRFPAVNLGPISIYVVPVVDTLAVNLGPISISVIC